MKTHHLYRLFHLFLSLLLGLTLSLSCQTQKPEDVVAMSFSAFREGNLVAYSDYMDPDSDFGQSFKPVFEKLEKRYGLESIQNLWKVLPDIAPGGDIDYLVRHLEIREAKTINRDSSVVIVHYPDGGSDGDDEMSLRKVRGSWKISNPGVCLWVWLVFAGWIVGGEE